MWELGAVLIDELKRRASCETPREIKINQRKRQKRKKEIQETKEIFGSKEDPTGHGRNKDPQSADD